MRVVGMSPGQERFLQEKIGGEMNTEKLTKILLGIIAVALWVIALNPWLRPMPVAAQEDVSFECSGRLKASAWGGTEPTIGGYSIDLDCD